jgi:hypothetical protein
MNVYLSPRNIDEIPSETIVVTFFSDEKPLQGETGLLDWRMNGYLSSQIQDNKISGEFGESTLIPCSQKINSKRIFLFGIGDPETFNSEKIRTLTSKIEQTLLSMNEKKFAFILSRRMTNKAEYIKHLKSFFNIFLGPASQSFESIYYHYEHEDERTAILALKNSNIKFFEEKTNNA